MIGYIAFMVGIVAFAFAVIYWFHAGEESKYEKLKRQLTDTSQRNLELYTKNKKLLEEMEELKKAMADAQAEVGNVQEHCAKLREGQIDLQDKLSKKRPVVQFQGPLQVEIYSPAKNLGGKRKAATAARK